MTLIWEELELYLYRAKVLGGWILKYDCSGVPDTVFQQQPVFFGSQNASITFIPDPTHSWTTEIQDSINGA